jgi:hypothetical protein
MGFADQVTEYVRHLAPEQRRATKAAGTQIGPCAGHRTFTPAPFLGSAVTNDNWGGGSALATAFGNVGAFALGATSRDAALLVTLQPGNYTAQVSGVNGTAGRAQVEVYEVP